jgi:hypothetical protein
MQDILDSLVWVRLNKADDFLKIKETLTRIGVASKRDNKLFQSCHILHKRNNYAIVHFKELFALDGKPSNITDEDIARRNTIVALLAEWNLITVIDHEKIKSPVAPLSYIKILPFSEKSNWELIVKYNIGKKIHKG